LNATRNTKNVSVSVSHVARNAIPGGHEVNIKTNPKRKIVGQNIRPIEIANNMLKYSALQWGRLIVLYADSMSSPFTVKTL